MFASVLGGVSLLGLAASAAAGPSLQQVALGGSNSQAHTAGRFNPAEDLGLLGTAGFTTLEHPAFPKHSVRIKKSDFCDTTVRAYTGYIDIEARHLFFYFFESRGDPEGRCHLLDGGRTWMHNGDWGVTMGFRGPKNRPDGWQKVPNCPRNGQVLGMFGFG
ncbi:hypothetical protein PsYK624_110380 [Phanerochaete sordida]|uniref:Uncharacterized protein n=1 Tax=Phanerochaete sordida TaxID=48140 RepID=A0A9P3GH41_9APHY|nr:hypothetical protein PsYK624_110380 [Phanerochaete sordida]